MLYNIIKSALRHLIKHPGYSILNILGLTIGIASALFLIIYVSDEVSYDKYHKNADRIYRVSSKLTETDDQFTWIVAQVPFGPQVASEYPEIESFVRVFNLPRALFRYDDREYFEEDFMYADSTLFDIFTYRTLAGDPRAAVSEPGKIALTKSTAARYFGDKDPVGKTLISGKDTYEVAAVIEDVPKNSHFRFDAVIARNNLPKQFGSWGNFGVFTYFMFPESYDIRNFEPKLKEITEKHVKPVLGQFNISVDYILEPIRKIHLYSTNSGEPEPTGSITYVYIFGIVALFLLLIAAMNYMNLATARSAERSREVGLRKVVGSQKEALIFQFLSESIIFTLIALLLAIVILLLALPGFNTLAGKSFELSILYSRVFIFSLLGIIILVGILGGSYPAFFLSGFSTVAVLKGERTQGKTGGLFRKIIVIIQFTVSVMMIMCTLIVFRQLNFLKNMEQGFDQSNIISLRLNDSMAGKYNVIKQAILENPEVKFVSGTNTPIGEGSSKVLFNIETDLGMTERGINFAVVDHDFIETLGIKMKEGRDFQEDMPSDTLSGVVVNESFVSRMGWKEAIGKRVELTTSNQIVARVIGVMKDYHQTGMYNEVETFMLVYRNTHPIIYVKLSGNNNNETLTYIESKWKEIFPGEPFTFEYLSDRFRGQFEADEKRGFIFTLFTVLAIIIACIGLFGLSSYTVEQRTKEIGIRKTFGADVPAVIQLISKDFIILVTISILIAVPLAFYIMSNWLENYVYRSEIGIMLVLTTALATIFITFLTIGYKAVQASLINPADSVKS